MKKISLILSVLVLSFTFTSCSKDFLSTYPTNQEPMAVMLGSTAGQLQALNGIHKMMYSQTNFWSTGNTAVSGARQSAGGLSQMYLTFDHMGEDMVVLAASANWFGTSYDWREHRTVNFADLQYQFTFLYQIINNANMLLENVDDVEDRTANEVINRNIRAQALFYRAFAHFYLVQMYGPRFVAGAANDGLAAPLMLQTTIEPQPQATVAAMYASIIADLEEAIQLFGDFPVTRSGLTAKSHISLPVAYGLRARVALTQQDWNTAITFAQATLDNLPTGVRLANANELREGFSSVNNPDWIWASYHDASQTTFFIGWGAYASMNFSSGQIRNHPRGINAVLYNSMDSADIRRDWWEGRDLDAATRQAEFPTLVAAGFNLPQFGVRKFRIGGETSIALNSAMDLAHMRVSEMYLIIAEANARAGNTGPAQSALTTLMEIRVPGFTTANTGDDLIEEIMTNRRIELWGEGFRFLDLKRTATPLVRTTAQGHRPAVAGPLTMGGITHDDPEQALLWLWVFPQRETDANPLVNNEGR